MPRPQFLVTLIALSSAVGFMTGCSPTGGTGGPVGGGNANGTGGEGSIEVLLPSSSGGNVAAIISSPNNELRVYGDHDGSGNVSALLGFQYMGSTGDTIRMGFGGSTDANARTMQSFSGSTYVEIDAPGGFLMQIDANVDGSLDVIYYDFETGTGGEVKNLTSVITSCQSYLEQAESFASDSGVEHTMPESVCFIKDALLCISAVGGATGVGGVAGQAIDFLDTAQDFVMISCEEVGSWLEVAGEALDALQEGFPGWIATVQQEIIDFVEGAVGGCDLSCDDDGAVQPPEAGPCECIVPAVLPYDVLQCIASGCIYNGVCEYFEDECCRDCGGPGWQLIQVAWPCECYPAYENYCATSIQTHCEDSDSCDQSQELCCERCGGPGWTIID